MAPRIKLVRGDTRPVIVSNITETNTGKPINITSSTVVMKFRAEGTTTILATLPGTLLTGLEDAEGNINTNSPYNVAGAGGRVSFSWLSTPSALTGAAGNYEGEIEITFTDTSKLTVFEPLRFVLRDDF